MKLPFFLLLAASVNALADGEDAKFAALPKAVPVIASGAIEQIRLSGASGTAEPAVVVGRDFAQAVRVRTQKRPAHSYEFQLRVPTAAAVRKGSRLLAVFEARAVEPQARDGVSETEFVFEQAGEPHTKSASHHVEFGWGSAVDARTLLGQGPDSKRYRQIILENFNKVVLENDLKWEAWSAHRQRALDAVAWLRERGLDVRGHVLVWPGKQNLPRHVIDLLAQPDALRRTLLEHITEEASALRGQLVEWTWSMSPTRISTCRPR